MKKLVITLVAIYLSVNCMAAPTEKVLNSFNRSFPAASNVVWSEDAENYVVYFSKGNEQLRLWYDKDGIVTKSIRYYEKELLHPFIKSKVEAKYTGKEIFSVTEVTSDAGVEYSVVLHDAQKWYHVKSDAAGNMSIEKKYNKG